ncbi:MAG: O-antigen ligase family protein [Chloroflexi bacterium]|nr:O-antigen ligase family protein [Chloroflexota bacterium]
MKNFHRHITDVLLYGMIWLIFFTSTWWWRPRWYVMEWSPFQDYFLSFIGTPQENAVYYVKFSLTSFIFLLAILWILSGFKGLWTLLDDVRSLWLLSLLALVVLARFSVGWATQNTDVAHSHAMQWVLAFVFVLIITAVKPKPKHIVMVLVAGLIINSLIGIAQVAAQSDIGIGEYGQRYGIGLTEFNLEPAESGTSVIQSRGVRYLRAYGITPHPNLLAAGLVMGLLASLTLVQRRWQFAAITVLGFWALLLTFSRASIGGFAVGVGVTAALWWLISFRDPKLLVRLAMMFLVTFGIFYIFYGDLINVRAGVGEEGFASTVETRSASDRQVYLEQAREIIREYPLKGIGIGNFPWESQMRLINDPRQLALGGQSVHNSYLLALSELGVIGAALFSITMLTAVGILMRRWRRGTLSIEAAALIGGVAAWLAIGWFEFFWWALLTHQVLFWGVIAVALIEERDDGSDQIQRRVAVSNFDE